jgi:hypothetical protein
VERRQIGKGCFVRTTEPVAVLRDQGHLQISVSAAPKFSIFCAFSWLISVHTVSSDTVALTLVEEKHPGTAP